jgi:hypothetical protein
MVPSRCAGAVYGSGSLRNETKRKRLCQESKSNIINPLLRDRLVQSKPPLKSLSPKRRYITQKTPETLDEKICPLARISESVSNGDDPSSVRPASRRPFDRRLVRSTRVFGVNNFTSFAFASRSSHAPHLTVSRGSRDRSSRRLGGHHRSGRLDDVHASDDGHVYDVCFLSCGRGKRGGFSRKSFEGSVRTYGGVALWRRATIRSGFTRMMNE